MIFGRVPIEILVYQHPVDMRKSSNGLQAIASQVEGDLLSGCVIVFTNRSKKIIKVLMWDRTGWCLVSKRLERGRFEINKNIMKYRELELLFDGVFAK